MLCFQTHLPSGKLQCSTLHLICGFAVTEKTSYPLTHWPPENVIHKLSVTLLTWIEKAMQGCISEGDQPALTHILLPPASV